MNNHPTNRILYVLAAISVLLFAISFLFEEHAGAQSKQPLLTLESPNKKSAGLGDDLTELERRLSIAHRGRRFSWRGCLCASTWKGLRETRGAKAVQKWGSMSEFAACGWAEQRHIIPSPNRGA